MKKIFTSIVFSFFVTYLHSQGVIKNIDTDNFPVVSICMQSNNPDTLVKENIHIFEDKKEGKDTKLSKIEIIPSSSVTEKSNILFLWDLRGEERLVLDLLNDFLLGEMRLSPQNENLKVNVAVFRRDENKAMVCRPLLSSFTNDIKDVWQNVIKEGEKELKDYSSSIDILWTLDQAINIIGTQPANEAKAIVLFVVGSVDTGIDATPILNVAKEKRIQLYIVNIDGKEQDENVSRNMSMRTYGMFLNVKSDEAIKARDKKRYECQKDDKGNPIIDNAHPFWFSECEIINSWIINLPKRWDGITYNLSFTSNYERIGQSKDLKIELGQDVLSHRYDIPGFSLGVWIKSHVILFIILLILALTLIGVGAFFLIRYLRDRAADKKETEEQIEEERKRLKAEQDTLRRKLELAESEQKRKQELEIRKDKNQKRQEYLSSIRLLMKSKNIKLRLLVSSMTGSFEYIIDEPETTIGTAEDNDVVLDDTTVSRHHALLYFNGEAFGIKDLKSTNGVVMNGFKVEDLKLRNGDSVSLGKTTLKVYF